MLMMAIITPAIGAAYLIWQIHRRDLRGWQHYACLTSLIFLISVLFLVGSGKVSSFGLAGNTIDLVDQRLAEIKALTEQNKQIAKATSKLVTSLAATPLMAGAERLGSLEKLQPDITELLKASGWSDSEIQKFIDEANKAFSTTNSQ